MIVDKEVLATLAAPTSVSGLRLSTAHQRSATDPQRNNSLNYSVLEMHPGAIMTDQNSTVLRNMLGNQRIG